MKKGTSGLLMVLLLILVLVTLFTASCQGTTPSPTPSAEPTSTLSSSPTPVAKPSPSLSPSPSPKPVGPTPAEFYKGKTVNWIIDDVVGTDDDVIARTLAPNLKEYLGASAVVVINKADGGGLEARNYLWQSKSEGLEFSTIAWASALGQAIMKHEGMQYKLDEFTYVGFGYPRRWVFDTVSEAGPYRKIQDLQAARNLKWLGSRPLGSYHLFEMLTAAVFNLDVKIAAGMGGADRVMALTNRTGDISAFAIDYISRYQEPGKRLIPIIVASDTRSPDYPDIPTLRELAPANLNPELVTAIDFIETLMPAGTTFIMPPGTAPDRAEFLTNALLKAHKDHWAEIENVKQIKFTEADLVPVNTVASNTKRHVQAGEKLYTLFYQLFEKYKA